MVGSSCSSNVLDARLRDWEATLKYVSNSGYASSEETLKTDNIKVFPSNGRVFYREHNGRTREITRLRDIPGKTMHFRKARDAHYAGANSLETARVEALTRAIYSGSIKITGNYACVNHIGTYPDATAPKLDAETPVPIKLEHGQVAQAMVRYHEVIVAKKMRKKIHVCHIKPEYSSTDMAEPLNSHSIYFAGVLPQRIDLANSARIHYGDLLHLSHLGRSGDIKTDKMDVTVLGLTNGLITTLFRNYTDGVLLKYSPSEFHTIETLAPIFVGPGGTIDIPVIWESDSNGRHVTIHSNEDVAVTWQFDTAMWISDKMFADDRCLHDDIIQKAARQFENLTLESYAKMVRASTLDVIAAYQRRMKSWQRSVCGHACYLFQGDGGLARDCIKASPMKRSELEGVALVATPHGDFALRTSAKVMYSLGEGGVWHIDPDGDTASVADSDLVGAGTLCESHHPA